MKKCLCPVLIVLSLAVFVGCSKDKPGKEQNSEGTPIAGNNLVSEDYQPGNVSEWTSGYFMRTEQGYYYYSKSRKGFRYYDIATGKDMFLCNKPECRHDGNDFCVATNDNYTVLNACVYSNRIYVYAMDETDTQYHLKVLSLALDGSELSEEVTVLSLEKMGQELTFDGKNFCIHRNNIMIALNAKGKDGLKDSELYGAAVVNLNTKKVLYLDEQPVSAENIEAEGIQGNGDWFYYCRKVKKKMELHRYNIVNGTDETLKLQVGFPGRYTILGEDTVAYQKMNLSALCFYGIDTGETVETKDFAYDGFEVDENGELEWIEETSDVDGVNGDGTYFYAISHCTYREHWNREGVTIGRKEGIVLVYDNNGKKVTAVNIAPALDEATPGGVNLYWLNYCVGLRFLGEEIYAEVPEEENYSRIHVFKCKRSDFLAGNPKFEHVFVTE